MPFVTSTNEFGITFLSVPVCPHAGGVGLCELVQHLIIFDYISVSGSLENRLVIKCLFFPCVWNFWETLPDSMGLFVGTGL